MLHEGRESWGERSSIISVMGMEKARVTELGFIEHILYSVTVAKAMKAPKVVSCKLITDNSHEKLIKLWSAPVFVVFIIMVAPTQNIITVNTSH